MPPMIDDSRLRFEQLGQLCRLLPFSIGASLLLAPIAAWVLWASTPHVLMLGWLMALLGCSVWRLTFWRAHRALRATAPDLPLPQVELRVRRLASSFRFGSLLAGMIWGSAALLLYVPSNVVLQTVLAFLLAGVTAGSTSSLATDRRAALAFQLPILLPLAGRLLWQHDEVHIAMAIMVLVYGSFITSTVHWLNAHIRQNTLLRLTALGREQALLQSEAQYRALALHDALTQLPNRLALQSTLSLRLMQAQEAGSGLALLYFDVDNFKDINDSRGHGCGDALLVEVAQRLRRHAAAEDFVARIGGDEFIVIRAAPVDVPAVEAFVARILASLAQPWLFDGVPVAIGASAGIGIFPDDGVDSETLMEHADIALYQAKGAGRNNYRFFTSNMEEARQERILLQRALAEAIGTEQLSIEYQPVVEIPSGQVIGMEALARWQHPERGLILPEVFNPIAEKCNLIDALGEQVLRLICAQLQAWRSERIALVPISFNVSPRQFGQGRYHELLARVLAQFDVPGTLLHLEITEAARMRGPRQQPTTLEALRALGVKLYYGTGFSSLNFLKDVPIDGLKIDKSFIQDLGDAARGTAIIGAVVGIGGSLGIEVVAEGVESVKQAVQLAACGCHAAQGAYFYGPMSAAKAGELLRKHESKHTWTDTLRKRMLVWAGALSGALP
jgi:diguanylate cyclase (GGDEF)-like protein